MRIVTCRSQRGDRAGIQLGEGIVDVWDALGGGESTVRELLESGRVEEARTAAESSGPGVSLSEVELLPPVPDPGKIVCIGLNYREHAAEAGIDPPESPTFFAKFRNALVPAGATVPLPAASSKVDYEAEVAFVVGRRASEVDESAAPDHIAGYMLLNDLSARDLQFATPQWIPGKVFDGSAPCGPALVTADEALSAGQVSFSLTLDGEVMQDAATDGLIFGMPELLAHLSRLMTLEPGDIVSTG